MDGTLSLSAQITFRVSQDPIEAAVLPFPSHNQLGNAMNQCAAQSGAGNDGSTGHGDPLVRMLWSKRVREVTTLRFPSAVKVWIMLQHTHRHGNTASRPERCTYCCCSAFDRTCLLIQNKAMHENRDKNHRSGDFSDQYGSTAAFSDGTVTAKRASSIFSVDSPQSCFRGSTGLSHWRNKTLIFPSSVFYFASVCFQAEDKKLPQDALMLNVRNWEWECIFITLYRWERLWVHLTLAPTVASCSKCLHILSICLLNGDGIASTGEHRGHGSAVGAAGESKHKALCASV